MSKFDYDCAKCDAICCKAPKFEKSDRFAHEKPKGAPCKNLDGNNACKIHDRLAAEGYGGCIAFSCYGCGPHLIKLYQKPDRKNDPALETERFEKFLFLQAAFQIASASEQVLKKNGISPKHLIKQFFSLVSTRQKVPRISDDAACDKFMETWNGKVVSAIQNRD